VKPWIPVVCPECGQTAEVREGDTLIHARCPKREPNSKKALPVYVRKEAAS